MLSNTIWYTEDQRVSLLLYLVNAEKVFDRINWSFLKEVLERMGFGPTFRTWIDMIYSGQTAEVFLEGFRFNSVGIHRGVIQGCSLSPVLFNIVIENLAICVRTRDYIKGFRTTMGFRKLCYMRTK